MFPFPQIRGPLNDLHITTSQKPLVLTIGIKNWKIYYCLNCRTISHAVHSSNKYILNESQHRKHEEITASKVDSSYSSTFGLKMINQKQTERNLQHQQSIDGDINISGNNSNTDEHLLRLNSLRKTLEQRLQKEIADTDERIQRYNEQQFALLKIFREKSEIEYQNLVCLFQNVPERLFKLQYNSDNDDNVDSDGKTTSNMLSLSAINATDTQSKQQLKQITSFDTPPATPESTPMSVGNSPVFRQQQQPQQQPQKTIASNVINGFKSLLGTANNGAVHNNNSAMKNNVNNNDDYLFDLEGLESYPVSVGNGGNGNNMSDDEGDETEDAQGELDIFLQFQQNINNTSLPFRRFGRIGSASKLRKTIHNCIKS